MIKHEEDLPKSIVVILVILAVLISILGTFTVLTEINKINSAPTVQNINQNQNGKITLKVVNPNEGLSATGKVTLTVIEK
ncbi:MAG: hypothetical protein QW757_01500 [Candidatus Woesearchaeota archaeon]